MKIMIYKMKLITLLLAAGSLVLPSAASEEFPQLTPTSRFDSVGMAYARDGKMRIEIRKVHLEAAKTGGSRHLSLLVLFEPTSRAFSWRLQATDESAAMPPQGASQISDEQAVFVKDGEIVDFWALMFRLYIRDCHGHASSMDDAEAKSLASASQSIASGEDLVGNGQDMRVVSFAAISNEFLFPPMSETPSVLAPRVVDVGWNADEQRWIVTLEARWRAVLTLDSDYKLMSIKKIDY
jgi:hypothetical protein